MLVALFHRAGVAHVGGHGDDDGLAAAGGLRQFLGLGTAQHHDPVGVLLQPFHLLRRGGAAGYPVTGAAQAGRQGLAHVAHAENEYVHRIRRLLPLPAGLWVFASNDIKL